VDRWQLEAEGYQIVMQDWDFRPGQDLLHQMQQAIQHAARTIAVLSPAYLGSEFGEAEWRAAFASDPTGERGLLLPVRVANMQPPALLRSRIYVDLVDKDATSARTALLEAAHGTRAKPTAEPEFPGAPGHPGGSEAPRFPGEPETQFPNLVGVHQWVWPREYGNTQSRHAFGPSAGTIKWPAPPPLDVAQATLVEWAREQRWISPSMFEGHLTVSDTSMVHLRVAAAFDKRRETPVQEYPGSPPGQPEIYDGRLQHARLSVDYGKRRWQNTSDWHGVRRGWSQEACPACTDGTVTTGAAKECDRSGV